MANTYDDQNLRKLRKKGKNPIASGDTAGNKAREVGEKAGGKVGADVAQAGMAAAEAAEGNVFGAVKNALEVIRRRWVEIILGGAIILSIIVSIWVPIIFGPFALVEGTIGMFKHYTIDVVTGAASKVYNVFGGKGPGNSNNICTVTQIPQWSEDALKTSGVITTHNKEGKVVTKTLDEGNNDAGCYGRVVRKAGQKTGVPWEMIAAIDFRNIEDAGLQNCYDCFMEDVGGQGNVKDRLEKIGQELQTANALRDPSGKLIPDEDGNYQNKIRPDGQYPVGIAEEYISNYHCLYVKKESQEQCFTDRYLKDKFDYYNNSHWLWDGFDADGYRNRLGVLGWYKNETSTEGYNTACSLEDLFRNPSASPNPGSPLSKVPLFSQCDPRWANNTYGATVCAWGCGPTSLAMVLAYYGQNTDPGQVAKQGVALNEVDGGSKWSLFPDVASKYYNMGSSQIGFSEAMQRIEKGNEPIIASTNMYGGHFIVLDSKKGDNITVNDPYPNGPDPYIITVSHLQSIDPSGAYFYVHP